jgi:hypothetical protein
MAGANASIIPCQVRLDSAPGDGANQAFRQQRPVRSPLSRQDGHQVARLIVKQKEIKSVASIKENLNNIIPPLGDRSTWRRLFVSPLALCVSIISRILRLTTAPSQRLISSYY